MFVFTVPSTVFQSISYISDWFLTLWAVTVYLTWESPSSDLSYTISGLYFLSKQYCHPLVMHSWGVFMYMATSVPWQSAAKQHLCNARNNQIQTVFVTSSALVYCLSSGFDFFALYRPTKDYRSCDCSNRFYYFHKKRPNWNTACPFFFNHWHVLHPVAPFRTCDMSPSQNRSSTLAVELVEFAVSASGTEPNKVQRMIFLSQTCCKNMAAYQPKN